MTNFVEASNIGYLLHPAIVKKLPERPKIADIGTGTGLFLNLLAEDYPEASFYGFDISAELFAAPETLSSNVRLALMNIKVPPPENQCSKYDVIHVRLLAAAMNPGDWGVAVRHIEMLLKPGGAVQWEECNFAQGRHVRGRAGSTIDAAQYIGDKMRVALKDKFAYGWSTLPQEMRDAGFVGVGEDIVSSDRDVETREPLTLNGMAAVFQWAKLISERGIPGSHSMEELADFEQQAFKDIRSGCYCRFDIHVVTGFKP